MFWNPNGSSKEPLARLTTDLWYWTSMLTDGSRESQETSAVGTGTSYYSLHNLFTFVTRGWQPGDPKRHMLRNWRRDKKDWGGNMGEEKINNVTAP